MTIEEARGFAARLWTLPRHSHKEMDARLAEDIAIMLTLACADARQHALDEIAKYVAAQGME